MATGDSTDIQGRINALLPPWFASINAVIGGLVAGYAAAWAYVYALYAYAVNQTRIGTSTDGWLDLIAQDFFGTTLRRKPGQSDTVFRARILAGLFQEKGTRRGMIAALTVLTGRAPAIVEPMRPADTGSYGGPMCGYGAAGAYGSMMLPAQCFITAHRPTSIGAPGVAGYGSYAGGYGVGASEYAPAGTTVGLADDDIYATIEAMRPAGVTCWTKITA